MPRRTTEPRRPEMKFSWSHDGVLAVRIHCYPGHVSFERGPTGVVDVFKGGRFLGVGRWDFETATLELSPKVAVQIAHFRLGAPFSKVVAMATACMTANRLRPAATGGRRRAAAS